LESSNNDKKEALLEVLVGKINTLVGIKIASVCFIFNLSLNLLALFGTSLFPGFIEVMPPNPHLYRKHVWFYSLHIGLLGSYVF
jgi:hypothetical protein